jgi:acyl-CoA thioesterase
MLSAKEFSLRDKFGTYNAMEVISVGKGVAVARFEIKDHHKNGLGTVHGGALFTLADLAFAAATNCGEEMTVSITAGMSFSKACTDGVLTAEAREVTRSSRLVNYEAKVCNEAGDIIALFQGTGYIKHKTTDRQQS